jgi:hypothetical protein
VARAPRLSGFDWQELARQLDENGYARLPGLLGPSECGELAALYGEPRRFRKRIVMEQHRFGAGEYQYFAYPLPPLVRSLRTGLYARLAPIANAWRAKLGSRERFPDSLEAFLARCRKQAQTRPTPLLLHYRAGGYNRLHQDLYGAVAFPLQFTCLLSKPGADFTGGEFLLLEQRPRMQSRGEAIALEQGEGIVFATRERPVPGPRGVSRAQMRHGVSVVRSGERTTRGIIFHDAQ